MEVFEKSSPAAPFPGLPEQQINYWIAFNRVLGIGPVKFRLLLDYFQEDLERAWHADGRELGRAGLPQKAIDAFFRQRQDIEPERERERLHKEQVSILTWCDPAYPPLLREIDAPPPVLYLKGKLAEADLFSLAVVGTRSADDYGRQVTERLVTELIGGKITIVSGLALGIDTLAHEAALNANGRTLAVQACGLNIVYPAKNARLARRIVESGQGALLSEYPLDVRPESGSFPARNRIISGLSQGVLVVQAGERSGALITASFALKQGRDVFAIPGSIFSSRSLGTNRLIRDGAQLVLEVRDILNALNLFMLPQQREIEQMLPENAEEQALLALLSHEPLHIDQLILESGLPAPTVTSTLTMLELKGAVKSTSGMKFVLTR